MQLRRQGSHPLSKRSRIAYAWICIAASAGLTLTACQNGTISPLLMPYVPGPAPSVFSGSIVDSNSGNGVVTLSLASASGLTSGTWNMSFGQKADPQYYISGTLSGAQYAATLNGCIQTDVSLNCGSSCTFSFTGTFDASSLTGTYKSTDQAATQFCPTRAGTINATKQ
jgi:hypothetical protein